MPTFCLLLRRATLLNKAGLKELLAKMVTPAAGREAIALLREKREVSERRACTMIGICRMTVR